MEFSLPLARIQPPVINMFKHALENGVQITEKSVPACCFQSFLHYLNKDDFDNAMKFYRVYKLKCKEVMKHLLHIFNEKIDKGNYTAVILLNTRFRLLHDKTLPAVKRSYEMNKKLGYINQAEDLKRKFMLRDRNVFGRMLEKIS